MTTRRCLGREEVVEKQNITLSLPREILKKGKVLAARKGISLNELVRELLQANTEDDGEYQASAERQIKRMKEGIQLGTKGKIAWKRDQLHQR
jgi:HSP90 family molecular chaperone